MSPHAVYFSHDLGATRRRRSAVVRIVAVLVTLAVLASLALKTHFEIASAATLRDRAEAGRLPTLDALAQARLDGFRAGLREAQEQGCTAPPRLLHPLEQQP